MSYHIISFSKALLPLHLQYTVNSVPLSRVNPIKDLGVLIDSELTSRDHIEYICTRARKIIGFIKRTTADFKNCGAIIHLYKTLVLPVLNYASPVKSPHYAYEVNKLKSVQHTFLRHIAWKSGTPMDWRAHDYSRVMSQFKIPTLALV